MNRALIAAAVACLMLSAFASVSSATCYGCDNGICVVAGLGQPGYSICIDDPEDGFCIVNAQSHCNGVCSSTIALTSARLFELPIGADQALFAAGRSSRELSGIPFGASCDQVVGALASLSGTSPSDWTLGYWHLSVAGSKVKIGARDAGGAGYAFSAEPEADAATIHLFRTAGQKAAGELAATQLGPSSVLVTRVVVDGRAMALVLQSQPMEISDDASAAALKTAQNHFKDDVQRFNSQRFLGLELMTPSTGLQLP